MPRKKAAPKSGAARRESAAAKAAAPETQETRGRPSKYQPEFLAQAEKLCALGAIDRDLADFFGVTEQTVNNWKNDFPEFGAALHEAKEKADAKVERSLYERALGFEHPELYIAQYQGKIIKEEITKKYPPEVVACIFWLKNRQPERWREKVDHEHATKPGDPIIALLAAIAGSNGGGRLTPKG